MNAPVPPLSPIAVPPGITSAVLDQRLLTRGPFPIVEPDVSVFAYRGQADSVRFSHPGLRDDLWFAPLEPERRWWVLCLAIPAGSRLEYRLAIDDHVVESAAFDRTTRTQVHLAAGVDSSDEERHPLVVVLDGPEHLQY